jgi:glucose dehydrogenase
MRGSDPKTNLHRALLLTALALALVPQSPLAAGDVDSARLRASDSEPENWFTLGRDQNQTYYSPLAKIDASNVSRLGFAWAYDLGTARGQEATPIVVDGAMYTSGTWGYVYALDAATGRVLWKFDTTRARHGSSAPKDEDRARLMDRMAHRTCNGSRAAMCHSQRQRRTDSHV